MSAETSNDLFRICNLCYMGSNHHGATAWAVPYYLLFSPPYERKISPAEFVELSLEIIPVLSESRHYPN